VACSQVLGLGDLTDRNGASSGNPNGVDGSAPTPTTDAGPVPQAGEVCKFDLSKFDDGCVFGP
jgi:hypothetical protein